MKSQHLFPLAAGALGFALAWVVKPTPEPVNSGVSDTGQVGGETARGPRGDNPRPRPSAISEKRPREVDASAFPLVELAEKGPKTRSEAKMLRLTEALELSMDQQAEIIRIVDETKISADADKPLLDDLVTRGRKVEETLKAILTPEQFAKLEELRVRERDNRIEARAFLALGQLMEEIDMSPGQRDDALARLRQAEKGRVQAVPASATLLLRTSVLPTGPQEPTMEGVLTIARLSETPPGATPQDAYDRYNIQQRQVLEEKLRCYDGVLTPAQMGQLHAIIAEEKAVIDFMRANRAPQPVQGPEPEPPIITDEDFEDTPMDEDDED